MKNDDRKNNPFCVRQQLDEKKNKKKKIIKKRDACGMLRYMLFQGNVKSFIRRRHRIRIRNSVGWLDSFFIRQNQKTEKKKKMKKIRILFYVVFHLWWKW